MEGTHPTPDAAVEPGSSGTPDAPQATEPAAPTAQTPPADQSAADSRLAQAEYTRSQQAFSQLRATLGLGAKATREEVLAAVDALRQRPDTGDTEDDGLTEREREAERRAIAAEMRVQEAIYSPIYGEGFGQKVVDLTNTLRQTNDPEEIVTSVVGFIEDITARRDPEPAPGSGAPSAAPGPPADIPVPEGDREPSARPQTPVGRRESGAITTVRSLFREAAERAATARQ